MSYYSHLTPEQIERIESELKEVDADELYRQYIDETHEPVEIMGLSFTPSRIVEELDPTAFRVYSSDFMDSNNSCVEVNGNWYDKREVDNLIEEMENEDDEN